LVNPTRAGMPKVEQRRSSCRDVGTETTFATVYKEGAGFRYAARAILVRFIGSSGGGRFCGVWP
jgi:hypothetical protein